MFQFKALERLVGFDRFANTSRELRALSDHQLRDIGVERSRIDEIVRKLSLRQSTEFLLR